MSEWRIGPRYHDRLGALVRDRLPEPPAGPIPAWLSRRGRRRRGAGRWLMGGTLAAAAAVLALVVWPRPDRAPRGKAGLMGSVGPRASGPAEQLDHQACVPAPLGPTGVDVTARASDEPWVTLGDDGRLLYRQDAQGNRVPDFSFAGYHGGDEPPRIAAATAALAPGGDDDTGAIQAALDQAARRPADARGFRGAVELEAGVFTLRGPLRINNGGVVLRGRGRETVLRAVGSSFHPALLVGTDAPRLRASTAHPVADAYVPVGARSLTVTDVTGLGVGDEILVERPATPRWECALGMHGLQPRPDGEVKSWLIGTELRIARRITALEGPRLTLDAPLPTALEQDYTPAVVRRYRAPQRLAEVGVEDLTFEAAFREPQRPGVEDALLDVEAVDDGWLRDIAISGETPIAVRLGRHATRITVTGATVASSMPRQIAFMLVGQLLLIQSSRTEGPGLRAVLTAAATAGPNAVVDFTAHGEGQAVETQRRWAAGLLLDNVRVSDDAGRPTGVISISNQGNRGSGHGWSGANSMVWNSSARWMVVDSPPTAHNWVTGGQALSLFGTGSYSGVGTPAAPASLYRAQRRERLGR